MGKNKIVIHVPNLLYFGGDVINGVVELDVHSEMKSRGVRLLFSGKEFTHWTEGSGSNSTTYTASRIFMFHRWDLAGAPRKNRKSAPVDIVQPGVYRWPIAFRLPDVALPTCHLYHGYIRYRCDAYVDIPRAFDLKTHVEIFVGGNYIPLPRFLTPHPHASENHKSFLFASGKLHMDVSTPNLHVVPGDRCFFHVIVNNESSKNVDEVKVTLYQRHRLHARNHSMYGSLRISHEDMHIDVPKKNRREFDLSFPVPINVMPSIIRGGEGSVLVHVFYELEVRLDVAMAVDLNVKLPIVIMRRDPKTIPQPVAFYPPPAALPQYPNQFAFNAPREQLFPKIDGFEYPAELPCSRVESAIDDLDDDEQSLLH